MKTCSKCGEEKELSEYYNNRLAKDGKMTRCKECLREASKRYSDENRSACLDRKKMYRRKNKEALANKKRQYYAKNKEALANKKRQYYTKNRESILEKASEYRITKKLSDGVSLAKERQTPTAKRERRRLYALRRYRDSARHRLSVSLRSRLRVALVRQNTKKSVSTYALLGCSPAKALVHLQTTAIQNGYLDFDINNYSGKEYHIDHIIPCASFDFKNKEEQEICFHYSNLQILSADVNLSKSDKIEGEVQYSIPI